ncbi:heme peroxidase [Epithele typhae]|uniref:heme peroxidase n=1 Tax=Epithele typhae TaxID=378194 RepID=UPI0020080406|nr:heme peroxidase [Epithele typhae]KAH9934460.1 heme peroxidase [Epithele typhae]
MFSKSILSVAALAVLATATPLKRATCSNGHTASDEQCCVWFDVLDDIQENLFEGSECQEEAHESLRLTFHDCIAYSPSLIADGEDGGGGCDGSIMKFSDVETAFHASIGLDEIVAKQLPYALKHNVSFGDFIQFAGAVGVSNCGGGPRLQFLTGRSNDSNVSPDGLIPLPEDTADTIIARFADVGISADEIVALLASHSVAAQDHVEPTIHGSPFDSTPSDFDAQFFVETLLKGVLMPAAPDVTTLATGEVLSPLPGELRLNSDFELARDNRTACEWQSYVTSQSFMMDRFTAAMKKMTVLGNDASALVDCSEVIPTPAAAASQTAYIPAGKNQSDIEPACSATPFPTLSVQAGAESSITPVPS